MKLFVFIYKTALCLAIDLGDIEIIKLLLTRKDIDVNQKKISKTIAFIKFHISILLITFFINI